MGMRPSFQLVRLVQWVCPKLYLYEEITSTDTLHSGTAGLIWTTIVVWLFMLALIASMLVTYTVPRNNPQLTITPVLRWLQWLPIGTFAIYQHAREAHVS
jgi:hypothetical protein